MYLAMAIAQHRARAWPCCMAGATRRSRRRGHDHSRLDDFRRLTRDIYIPPGDLGFWQGAIRDPSEPIFAEVRAMANASEIISIELLYGDLAGGQRAITRFALLPHDDDGRAGLAGGGLTALAPRPASAALTATRAISTSGRFALRKPFALGRELRLERR